MNEDLIGKVYVNGTSIRRFVVTGIDREFPSVLHYRDLLTLSEGCILDTFVRHNLIGEDR